jgi:prepilin-type N-terminal cleavage/methylation domain-containing protein
MRSFFMHATKRTAPTRRRGFTLIESAVAVVIVGTGVLALVAAQQAWHAQNAWAERAAVGARLGNEIREMTFDCPRHDPVTGASGWGPETNEVDLLDFDDLDDFDGILGHGLILSGADGSGPVNALREVIPGMDEWTQTIRVYNVDPGNVNVDVDDAGSDMMRVEVTIDWQGGSASEPTTVTRVTWIAPR